MPGTARRNAAACGALVLSLACAARNPNGTATDPAPSAAADEPERPGSIATGDAAEGSVAQPVPESVPALTDTRAPASDGPPPVSQTPGTAVTPGQVQFATLAPLRHAELRDGWLVVHVAAVDDTALARVQDATGYGETWLWAGHRSIPSEVRELGSIHVVSPSGALRLDTYARIAADANGWLIAYRRTAAKQPALALRGAPAGQARVRVAPKPKPIKRAHAMAARMRELLAKTEVGPDVIRRLGHYQLQIVPGSFPGANRIVTVAAYATGVDQHDPGEYNGVVFTLDEGDAIGQVVLANGDPTVVDGVVDLDGDGLDEVLTTSSGYESGSGDVHRLTHGNVETLNLWSHVE